MNYSVKLNQKCCYWATPVSDGRGKSTYTAETEISCRWNNRNVQYLTPDGETRVATATVFVNQDVTVGGYLWLGKQADLPSPHTDPEAVASAYPIKQFVKTFSIDGTECVRKAYI